MTVMELTARGIGREEAEQAAAGVDTEDWRQALELLRKKKYNGQSGEEEKRKAFAALVRKGYAYADIRRAAAELDDEHPPDEGGWEE